MPGSYSPYRRNATAGASATDDGVPQPVQGHDRRHACVFRGGSYVTELDQQTQPAFHYGNPGRTVADLRSFVFTRDTP